MATETEQNSLKSILVNFRKRDRKKIIRYLKKSIKDLRKDLRNK